MRAAWEWLKKYGKIVFGGLVAVGAVLYLGRGRSRVEDVLDARDEAEEAHKERLEDTQRKQREAREETRKKSKEINDASEKALQDAKREVAERGPGTVAYESLFMGNRKSSSRD